MRAVPLRNNPHIFLQIKANRVEERETLILDQWGRVWLQQQYN